MKTTSLIQDLFSLKNLEQVALEHHIEGVLFKQFDHFESSKKFKTRWLMQWQYTNCLRDELTKLASLINGKNTQNITVLKGMALTDIIYQDLGSRFMSDVDILINIKDSELISNSLIKMGYKNNKHKEWAGNNFKSEWIQTFNGHEINFEIHTALFYHSSKTNYEYEDFSIAPFKRLAGDDLFIHLVGHLVFQHTFLKLYWLLDIILLIKNAQYSLDWQNIAIKSKQDKVYRSAQMAIFVIHKYFSQEVKIDNNILELFELDQKKVWMYFLSKELLLSPNHTGIKYWLTKHFAKDHLTEALYYDFVWLINKIKEKF